MNEILLTMRSSGKITWDFCRFSFSFFFFAFLGCSRLSFHLVDRYRCPLSTLCVRDWIYVKWCVQQTKNYRVPKRSTDQTSPPKKKKKRKERKNRSVCVSGCIAVLTASDVFFFYCIFLVVLFGFIEGKICRVQHITRRLQFSS